MVYRLNETTWLQDVGGGAEIFYFLNWAMLTIDLSCCVTKGSRRRLYLRRAAKSPD